MLRYFGNLLFPCLNYHGVQKRKISLKLVNNRIVILLFCFHFDFLICFFAKYLERTDFTWDEIRSRFFHLNEICDSIASEQVLLRSRYQNVSGKKLDYQFTVICYFLRSRMRSFSIYLAWQMMTSP